VSNSQPAQNYKALTPEKTRPLRQSDLTIESMDQMTTAIMRTQAKLEKWPILRQVNLVGLLQNATPANLQKKITIKKAVQTAQYLGEYNQACIAFWRDHGISDLDFLSVDDVDSLRKLPAMTSDYFYTYSPEDRFSRSLDNVTMLSSSGSTGKSKFFLTSPKDVNQTLPALKQFLKANWQVDHYDHVEILVHTIMAEPDQPQWGAGYNMIRLLALMAEEFPHINYRSETDVENTVAHIREVMAKTTGKTLLAIYSYPPDAITIARQLIDLERPNNLDFKFMFTGEATPPYRLFQFAKWLKITEPGFEQQKLADILEQPKGRRQLQAIVRSFSTGFGTAEIQTGLSGSADTTLWNVIMHLLNENEPERTAPFLQKCFQGESFPWSVFKASPNVFFLLGEERHDDGKFIQAPGANIHSGTAFATSLAGAVVNCRLDHMHIWDKFELAYHLKQETGVDIRNIARKIGIKYGPGEIILTNGRMDSTKHSGLEAAISWGGQSIYGHNFQTAAAQIDELSGLFTAQSIDYRDGHRTFWIHFEAVPGVDPFSLQAAVASQAVEILVSVNSEFAHRRQLLLDEGGEERFQRTVQIRVLPHGHHRFQRRPGQIKFSYVRKPQFLNADNDPRMDPIISGLVE